MPLTAEEISQKYGDRLVDPNAMQEASADPTDLSAYPSFAKYQGRLVAPGQPQQAPEKVTGDVDPTWGDYGRMVMAGGAQIGSGIGWLFNSFDWGESLQQAGQEASEWWMDGLSEQAKQAMQVEFTKRDRGELWTDAKWNKAKLTAMQSLLGTMAGMGVGSILTKGLAAAGMTRAVTTATGATVQAPSKMAGAIGYGLGEAGVAAPSAGAGVEQEIMDMDHETLYRDAADYRAVYEALENADPSVRAERAKTILAKAAAGDAFFMAMVSTFVLSAPAGTFMANITAGMPLTTGGGRLAGGMRGAGTEALQEFGQSGAEKISENIAMQQADPSRPITKGALEEAVGGMMAGGLMGAGPGLAATPGQGEAAPDVPEDKESPLAAFAAGDDRPIAATDIDPVTGEVVLRYEDSPETTPEQAERDELDVQLEDALQDLEMGIEMQAVVGDVARTGEEQALAAQGSRNAQMLEMEASRDAQLAKQRRIEEERAYAQAREQDAAQTIAEAEAAEAPPLEGEMVTPAGVPVEEEPIDIIGGQPAEAMRVGEDLINPAGGRPFGTSLGEAITAAQRPPEEPGGPEGPAGGAAAITPPTAPAVPEPAVEYTDERLRDETYRANLQEMSKQLTPGGGITLIPDTDAPGVTSAEEATAFKGRTKSTNPGWFQATASEEGVSVKQVWNAVEKALAGKRLGVRQKRVIEGMLDTIEDERQRAEAEFEKEQAAEYAERAEDRAEAEAILADRMGDLEERRPLGELTEAEIPFEPVTTEEREKFRHEKMPVPKGSIIGEARKVVSGEVLPPQQYPTVQIMEDEEGVTVSFGAYERTYPNLSKEAAETAFRKEFAQVLTSPEGRAAAAGIPAEELSTAPDRGRDIEGEAEISDNEIVRKFMKGFYGKNYSENMVNYPATAVAGEPGASNIERKRKHLANRGKQVIVDAYNDAQNNAQPDEKYLEEFRNAIAYAKEKGGFKEGMLGSRHDYLEARWFFEKGKKRKVSWPDVSAVVKSLKIDLEPTAALEFEEEEAIDQQALLEEIVDELRGKGPGYRNSMFFDEEAETFEMSDFEDALIEDGWETDPIGSELGAVYTNLAEQSIAIQEHDTEGQYTIHWYAGEAEEQAEVPTDTGRSGDLFTEDTSQMDIEDQTGRPELDALADEAEQAIIDLPDNVSPTNTERNMIMGDIRRLKINKHPRADDVAMLAQLRLDGWKFKIIREYPSGERDIEVTDLEDNTTVLSLKKGEPLHKAVDLITDVEEEFVPLTGRVEPEGETVKLPEIAARELEKNFATKKLTPMQRSALRVATRLALDSEAADSSFTPMEFTRHRVEGVGNVSTSNQVREFGSINFNTITQLINKGVLVGVAGTERPSGMPDRIRVPNIPEVTPDIPSGAEIDAAANEAEPDQATEAQKKAGNYKKGHLSIAGFDITIENPVGTVRHGRMKMKDHYGYIKRTEGKDGDQVDVFVNPKAAEDFAGSVFVVDQWIDGNQNKGFDEHKVMLGYKSKLDALRAYRRNYEKGWTIGPLTEFTVDEFKAWLAEPGANKQLASKAKVLAANKAAAKKDRKDDRYALGKEYFNAPNKKWLDTVLGECGALGDVPDTMPLNELVSQLTRLQDTKTLPHSQVPVLERATQDRVTQEIARINEKFPGAKIRLVNYADVKAELAETLEKSRENVDGLTVPAVYIANRNEIYLFRERIHSVRQAKRLALHEMFHKGIHRLGIKDIDAFMEDFYENMPVEHKVRLKEIMMTYGLDEAVAEDRIEGAEEVLANLAETEPNHSWVRKFVAAIRNILEKAGIITTQDTWTDAEISALIAEAHGALARTRDQLGGVTLDEDVMIEETGEVFTVQESATELLSQHDKRKNAVQKLKACLGR